LYQAVSATVQRRRRASGAYRHCVKDDVFIDPPYNTGNDFVYEDEFADSINYYKKITGQALKSNPETAGRYHTNWLNMMYPRLKLARSLLREDGVIFISIDDNEQANLKKLYDEIFSEDNFIACFPRITKKAGKTTDAVAKNNDYVLLYSKTDTTNFYLQRHTDDGYKFEDEFLALRGKYKLNQTLDYDSLQYSPSLDYPIEIDGKIFYAGNSYEKYLERKKGNFNRADWAWRWSKELFDFGLQNGFIVVKNYEAYSRIYTKTYQNVALEKTSSGFEILQIERRKALSSLEFVDNQYSNDNAKKNLFSIFNVTPFDYSKPIALLKQLLAFSTTNDDIILDFFSGSATTARAIMQINSDDDGNRKFIMVQLPEQTEESSEAYKAGFKNICEIGKERIRLAGEKIKANNPMLISDIDVGFKVFKLDSSNLKIWDNSPSDNEMEVMNRIQENIFYLVSERNDIDMVYEIMLKYGLPITLPVKEISIKGTTGYIVSNPTYKVFICLQSQITLESVEQMLLDYPEIGTFIFADKCFTDANALINTQKILKKSERKIRLF
jgi:adenine specific DNA methylase Mod